ncbi:MAG TPA: sulfatase-like hydrolase/transferase [Candidatus Hydrogenedentes bacterium]|nr:sulfatase-like hydrolase/transferase [Candidatus Hydrogenedentota bacterium]
MSPHSYNRRQFMELLGITAAGLALPSSSLAAEEGNRRPNILVIMSDEHNASVLGCTGNKIVQTPALDRLAQGGIVFDNCYCNSPLCVPSRLAFTSGKYVSRVGAWNNNCWLPSPDYPSVARLMNAAGYESFLCGKMHYDATQRYGFTEIGGQMNKGHMNGKGERRAPDDLAPEPGISKRFDEFHPGDHSHVLDHDRDVTAGTLEFLKNRKDAGKPFFLLSGYVAPHFPLIVPEKYWDAYKGKVPMPNIPEGLLDALPLNYKHLRIGFNVEDAPEDMVRKGRELYYGLVQWLDEEIGKVLQSLEDAGLAENTIVIYTADHGENMGEHGLWWKNCLYDSATKVPLIVRWPAKWKGAQHRTQACSLVDVARTVAELGGATVPEDWNGDSMIHWLEDPKAPWKDQAVSEYYAHNIASGYAMIRMGQFKYTYHTRPDETHPPERELYDLAVDPQEFHNLAGKPEYAEKCAAMHAALVKELGKEPDQIEQRCRADYKKGYGRDDIGKSKQKKKGL